jgi:hypothetical protein
MGNCILVATPYSNRNIKPHESHELSVVDDPNISSEDNKSMYTDFRSIIHHLFPKSPSRRVGTRQE